MAEYNGKVAFCMEDQRLYAIPEDVQDNLVNPDFCRTVHWIDHSDNPDDRSGHWELVPEDEDTYPLKAGESDKGTWPGDGSYSTDPNAKESANPPAEG